MSEQIKYYKHGYSFSILNMRRTQPDTVNEHGDGYYLHHSGSALRIYYDTGYGNRSPSTTLDMRYGAVVYSKVYLRTFTQRGLQLVCARFVTDVLSGKVDRLIREQKKKA
jgi:hypothetical protein